MQSILCMIYVCIYVHIIHASMHMGLIRAAYRLCTTMAVCLCEVEEFVSCSALEAGCLSRSSVYFGIQGMKFPAKTRGSRENSKCFPSFIFFSGCQQKAWPRVKGNLPASKDLDLGCILPSDYSIKKTHSLVYLATWVFH